MSEDFCITCEEKIDGAHAEGKVCPGCVKKAKASEIDPEKTMNQVSNRAQMLMHMGVKPPQAVGASIFMYALDNFLVPALEKYIGPLPSGGKTPFNKEGYNLSKKELDDLRSRMADSIEFPDEPPVDPDEIWRDLNEPKEGEEDGHTS